MHELANVFEILAPEVNEKELIEQIQERMQQRQAQAEVEGETRDSLAEIKEMDSRASGRFVPELYYDLYQAHKSAEAIGVSLSLVDSRVPLIGRLLTRLRREPHNLVVYYVNMLAGRQAIFNRAVANILSQLVHDLDEPENQTAELEAELASLRQRVEALEKMLIEE